MYLYVSVLAQHQYCDTDPECANITCNDNTHSAYCHTHECHCHSAVECDHDSDCTHCGDSGYSCDDHHCHGPKCTHHRK